MTTTSKKSGSGGAARQPYVLRLPADLHRELRLYSVGRGESLNDLLVEAIRQWWVKQPDRAAYSRLAKSGPAATE